MVVKKCVICGKEFDAKGSAKTCSKGCRKENQKRYNKQYRQDNKEYYRQYGKQYRQDNKEYYRQYKKQYRQNNKESIQEYQRKYHKQYYQDENKEHILKYKYQYYKEKVNELIKQYDGDLEEILENIPSRWQLREAQMRVWFNESYYDGIIAKMESTPCCEVTGEKDNLVVHHLYSFNTYPILGNDLSNMVRINKKVHDDFHKQYGYGNNTTEQWEQFIKENNNII